MLKTLLYITLVTAVGAVCTALMIATWNVLCWAFGCATLNVFSAIWGFFSIGFIFLRLISVFSRR